MANLFYQTFYGDSYLFGEGAFKGTMDELEAHLRQEIKDSKEYGRPLTGANAFLIDGKRMKHVFQFSLRKSKNGRVTKSDEQIKEKHPPITLPETYRVPDHNMGWVDGAFKKLAKRAAKLGVEGVGYEVVKTEKNKLKDGTVEIIHVIKPIGKHPQLDGWRLAATLQHEEAGNIVRAVPGEEIPAAFRSAKSHCDHCMTSRFRKETFLVRHEDGRLMQIGRSCLQDFFDGKSPHSLIGYASWVADIEQLIAEAEERGPGGSYRRPIVQEYFLTFVAAFVRQDGRFISATAARELEITGTADKAMGDMFPWAERDLIKDPLIERTSEDEETVAKALAWVQELSPSSEYQHNLKIVASKEELLYKDVNLSASIILAYKMATEKREKKERVARAGENSVFVGKIGERGTFTATLDKLIGFESTFGYMQIHKFLDAEGNVLVWKTTSGPGIEEGEQVTFKATIKDHDVYDGVRQTVLTRLAVQ